MAIVSLANNAQNFDCREQLLTYNRQLGYFDEFPGLFSWVSTAVSNVKLLSSSGDFTYDANDNPTGGTISAFNLDLGNDAGAPELTITGLAANLGNLSGQASLTADQQNNLVWRTMLAGNDDIRLGSHATADGFYINFAGDGRSMETGQSLRAGSDKITGDIGGGEIYGDLYNVAADSSLRGGNDKLSVSGNGGGYIYGDTGYVNGVLHAGNDSIAAGLGIDFIMGDANVVVVGASVIAGADTITMRATATAYGDVNKVQGVVTSGNDRITGSSAGDQISGDVYQVASSGTLAAGADTVHGGAGNDTIHGDWLTVEAGGDAVGESDKLYGDAGRDTIFGNGGNDSIDGGSGDDKLLGGKGADTFVFAKGDGKDTIADFSASGKGHDLVDLSGLDGVDTLKEAQALFENHNKDVWIYAGHGDVLIIKHVEIHDLSKADFIF